MKHAGFGTILIVCYLLISSGELRAQSDGYLSPFSVAQGEKLSFYISISNPAFDLHIFKLGAKKIEVLALHDLPGGIQQTKDSAFILGCNWKVTKEIEIP